MKIAYSALEVIAAVWVDCDPRERFVVRDLRDGREARVTRLYYEAVGMGPTRLRRVDGLHRDKAVAVRASNLDLDLIPDAYTALADEEVAKVRAQWLSVAGQQGEG